jgi:hypothetical protein
MPVLGFISTRAKTLRIAVAICCSSSFVTGSAVPRVQETEQSVKAAFVYNFTRFVTWPASAFSGPASPFVIGIVGSDSLQGALDTIVKNKDVSNRSIVVKRFGWADVETCNLLFIPADESSHATQLAKLRNHAILIVSESSGMLRRGSTINLYLDEDRVMFEISPNAARDTGLTISSHLLSLARPAH